MHVGVANLRWWGKTSPVGGMYGSLRSRGLGFDEPRTITCINSLIIDINCWEYTKTPSHVPPYERVNVYADNLFVQSSFYSNTRALGLTLRKLRYLQIKYNGFIPRNASHNACKWQPLCLCLKCHKGHLPLWSMVIGIYGIHYTSLYHCLWKRYYYFLLLCQS